MLIGFLIVNTAAAAASSAVSLAVVGFWLPETARRPLEEIAPDP